MKRITTWAAVATVLIASSASAGTEQFGWSLSGSNTDSGVNTGPAVGSTPIPVYLWLVCSTFNAPGGAGFGMSAAEFSVSSAFFNAGFTPDGGALNAGDGTNLLLAVGGCPAAGTILGFWNFIDFAGLGGTVCLVNSPGGVNGTVDCDTVSPLVHSNAIDGFTTDGSKPCEVSVCTIDAVEPSTWGALKSLYR